MIVVYIEYSSIHLSSVDHILLLLLFWELKIWISTLFNIYCVFNSMWTSSIVRAFYSSQHFYGGPGSSATLPNNLQRAASTSKVPDASYPTHYHTLKPRTKPTSISDLSDISSNGPFFMPSATRRQRRASLVSDWYLIQCLIISMCSLQSDIGFGKLQSYIKLEKLGEVCESMITDPVLFKLHSLFQGTYATVYKGKSR